MHDGTSHFAIEIFADATPGHDIFLRYTHDLNTNPTNQFVSEINNGLWVSELQYLCL